MGILPRTNLHLKQEQLIHPNGRNLQNYYWFLNSDLNNLLRCMFISNKTKEHILVGFKGSACQLKWGFLRTGYFLQCAGTSSRAARWSALQCVPSAALAGLTVCPNTILDEGEEGTLPPLFPGRCPSTWPPPLPLNKPLALDELANLHDSRAEARESGGEKMS